MNSIKVLNVEVCSEKLRVNYQLSSGLERYFSPIRTFEAEYSENIETVPFSVLVIPFVCNVLPIVWLTDSVLELNELDREFYEAIPGVLKGYRDMSPMLAFRGSVQAAKIVDNHYEATDAVAALFSGGVDAFATLVAHITEKPTLITLWGADVRLTDQEGWDRVSQHVRETVNQYALPTPLLIRTNFRSMVKEGPLGELVAAAGDGWWHGYQHGIAILGHAAPSAYLHRWKTVYIASSFTPDNKAICASDPTIDNNLQLVSTRVWHDQYEFHRQWAEIRAYASRLFDCHFRNISDPTNGSSGTDSANGKIDYFRVVKALADIGYEGACGIELANAFPKNPEWIPASVGYFRALMDAVARS